MTSNALEDDPKILLGHLFRIFYCIQTNHLNKILCSTLMVLPSILPFFGCLTLYKVSPNIFKCHLGDPYLLDFPSSFLCKAICQFLSYIARVTPYPSDIKWDHNGLPHFAIFIEEMKYHKNQTISRDFFLTLSTLRLIQRCGLFMDFSAKGAREERQKYISYVSMWTHAAYSQVRLMYGWNDFSFKNVLGAAYNQVRFIVRNLR